MAGLAHADLSAVIDIIERLNQLDVDLSEGGPTGNSSIEVLGTLEIYVSDDLVGTISFVDDYWRFETT